MTTPQPAGAPTGPPRNAVIVDIDGTLCDTSSAQHHVAKDRPDFDSFFRATETCPPNQWVLDWCHACHEAGLELVVITGRSAAYRDLTQDWLTRNLTLPYIGPGMRPEHDFRPDTQIKYEIYQHLRAAGVNIVSAIDDRPSILRMWRSVGLNPVVVYQPSWEYPQRKGSEIYGELLHAVPPEIITTRLRAAGLL